MLAQYIHDHNVLPQTDVDTEQRMTQPEDELERTLTDHEDHHEFIGDKMDEDVHDKVLRIYIQNLNGLNWDNTGGKWPYVCKAIDAIGADIACFSELNIRQQIHIKSVKKWKTCVNVNFNKTH